MDSYGLGIDNSKRLKELAQESSSTSNITTELCSEEPSSRRDAALKLISQSSQKSPALGPALMDALSDSLKPSASKDESDGIAAANAAEASLAALYTMDVDTESMQDSLLLKIVAYTDANEPWTTDAAASTAERLLDKHLPVAKKQDFITRHVLQGYLRHIFSKTTSSVTAEGRPALFRELPPDGGFHAQKASWKEAGPHIVTVFNWAVNSSEPETVKKHWPLYVPVLVTLAEDDDVAIRQRGIEILNVFLAKCPAEVLRVSGIGSVFQEAVFPSLLFLPTLTPEPESVALLGAAYHMLLTLALADPNPASGKRRELLDKLLRDGVLAGYFHASQHIRVVEVLMQSAEQIVDASQVYAVKHLQSLLDLFAPVLTDAFALAYAPAVLAAAKALNTTIINCWPRIVGTPHAEQIINIVSRAWTNIQDSANDNTTKELESLSKELTKTTTLLAALWKESDDQIPTETLSQIAGKAPHLRPLFKPFFEAASAT